LTLAIDICIECDASFKLAREPFAMASLPVVIGKHWKLKKTNYLELLAAL